MEKFCPVCGRGYDAALDTCEDDGERLVIVSEEPSLVGRELEGKYTITDELGEGGMGSVYLAYQSTMDREVAVKVLKRQFCQNKLAIKRFLREARAASKLAHPNTITVYDFGQSADGLLYMVMEKLNGKPLADILDDEGMLHPERAVHILSQVCDSLAEAHANGITHRDLKPENIFIEPKFGNPEHVKVLDFGIAKMADGDNTQATATGMICGTPSYMSPEQAMGKAIDGRSDIYALGILLYEMLAAERPFDGDTAMEVMLKHLNEPPPPLPDLVRTRSSQELIDILHDMLAKHPGDRPADCQELKMALQASIGNDAGTGVKRIKGPTKDRPATVDAITSFDKGAIPTDTASSPPVKGRSWRAVAAALLLLVGGGVALVASGALDGDPKDASAEIAEVKTDLEAVEAVEAKEAAEIAEADRIAEAESQASGKPESVGSETARSAASQPAVDKAAEGSSGQQPTAFSASEGDDTPKAGAAIDAEKPGAVARKATAEVAAKAAQPPPAAQGVSLTVRSTPDGAYVWDGQNLVGQTPLTLDKPKNSGTVQLKLTAEGFKDKEVLLGTVQSYTSTVTMVSLTAAPASKTSDKRRKKKAKTVKKAKKVRKKPGNIGTF